MQMKKNKTTAKSDFHFSRFRTAGTMMINSFAMTIADNLRMIQFTFRLVFTKYTCLLKKTKMSRNGAADGNRAEKLDRDRRFGGAANAPDG